MEQNHRKRYIPGTSIDIDNLRDETEYLCCYCINKVLSAIILLLSLILTLLLAGYNFLQSCGLL